MSDGQRWDIYQTESLVLQGSMSLADIRHALAQGKLGKSDLIRPAGSSEPWKRLSEFDLRQAENVSVADADLLDPNAEIDVDSDSDVGTTPPQKTPVADQASIELQALQWLMEEDEPAAPPRPPAPQRSKVPDPVPEKPPLPDDSVEVEPMMLEPSIELELTHRDSAASLLDVGEDEEDDFTLSRSRVEHVEEMDLAAMVDIAFQLVLFFMVTSAVTMIKSMDLPKPSESTKPAAASAPGVGARNRNELADEFIVVSIDSEGEILVDDEPTSLDELTNRLRATRNESGKTGMLLRAENKTKHRTAVAAYDAANEIGLRIAIERESSSP